MTISWGASSARPAGLHHVVLAMLAFALLMTGITGHAGVQVLDRAAAARLFPLHRHGVPGEAAWIAAHGTWEGFVGPHCHADYTQPAPQPGPDDVQAATSLAGSLWCATAMTVLSPPPLAPVAAAAIAAAPADTLVLPPLRPPR